MAMIRSVHGRRAPGRRPPALLASLTSHSTARRVPWIRRGAFRIPVEYRTWAGRARCRARRADALPPPVTSSVRPDLQSTLPVKNWRPVSSRCRGPVDAALPYCAATCPPTIAWRGRNRSVRSGHAEARPRHGERKFGTRANTSVTSPSSRRHRAYYGGVRSATPLQVKAILFGALASFVLPIARSRVIAWSSHAMRRALRRIRMSASHQDAIAPIRGCHRSLAGTRRFPTLTLARPLRRLSPAPNLHNRVSGAC